ncbi:transcriptional repressor TraM [Mesorhizobium sp. BHbdii]
MSNRHPIDQPSNGLTDAISALLSELTMEELARVAEDVVRENRRRVSLAQSLFDKLQTTRSGATENGEELLHAYRLSLLKLRMHHELVRIVIAELGHVPDIGAATNCH